MTAKIIDGKKIAQEIEKNIKDAVSKLNRKPHLAVIMVGENPSSEIYVASKEKRAKELGFEAEVIKFKSDVSKEDLLQKIEELNASNADGILLQLPLPKHLLENDFADKILPNKDVDGFHPYNLGKLLRGETPYAIPCTPKGIVYLLKKTGVELEGKNCVVVGRSNIVGKPLAYLLLKENATVTVAHSKTRNLKELTLTADILISATGVKNIITSDMVKNGAVVIDVGVSRDENNKVRGDVDFENVKEVASYITPVPGGVGPMTVAELMENTLELSLKNNGQ